MTATGDSSNPTSGQVVGWAITRFLTEATDPRDIDAIDAGSKALVLCGDRIAILTPAEAAEWLAQG